MEQDELVQYSNYEQPWKLDSGASRHYFGKNIGVRNRQKKLYDIKVQVTNGKNMDQVEEGTAPFNGLTKDAADVQIFPHMPNPLVSCGKIVKQGYTIILDDLIATVINKDTNEVVMEVVFDERIRTRNIYPNGLVSYDFKEKQEVDSLELGITQQQQQQQQQQGGYAIHLANNAYRLTTKKEIVEFYYATAGWLVKRT